MPPSLDPDGLIRQGACDEGYKPVHAEVPLAAAAFSLREAIHAFPQGCTENEYREWVNEMNAIMVSSVIWCSFLSTPSTLHFRYSEGLSRRLKTSIRLTVR